MSPDVANYLLGGRTPPQGRPPCPMSSPHSTMTSCNDLGHMCFIVSPLSLTTMHAGGHHLFLTFSVHVPTSPSRPAPNKHLWSQLEALPFDLSHLRESDGSHVPPGKFTSLQEKCARTCRSRWTLPGLFCEPWVRTPATPEPVRMEGWFQQAGRGSQ